MTNFIKLLFLIFLLTSCTTIARHSPSTASKTLDKESDGIFIAQYGDFGPPQLASSLIGNKWWQWDDPENHLPVTYDVKVVVYRNIDIELVQKSFPVIPELKQDYRYVQYREATEYFSNRLSEFEQDMQTYETPEDLGMMCIFPLKMYKTALAMEMKLRK